MRKLGKPLFDSMGLSRIDEPKQLYPFLLTKSVGNVIIVLKKSGAVAPAPCQKQSTLALTSESCLGIFILTPSC